MKNTKLYILMMFAAMQTGFVFSMDSKQAAHQAIVAYATIAKVEKDAFYVFLDSSSFQAQKHFEECKAKECVAREELVRKYPQYVSDQLGTVFVHINGGYAVTGMRVERYLKSQNKSRPFQLAARETT